MDRLDKWSALFIAVLVMWAALLVTREMQTERPSRPAVAQRAGMVYNPELDKKLEAADSLVASNNLQKAEELVNSLIAEFPYDGRPFMVRGDIYLRQQNPVRAMLEYRSGVDLNSDFLDKKTPLFQGRKIKNVLEEVKLVIATTPEGNETAADLKKYRDTLYYMLRKVAGGCG